MRLPIFPLSYIYIHNYKLSSYTTKKEITQLFTVSRVKLKYNTHVCTGLQMPSTVEAVVSRPPWGKKMVAMYKNSSCKQPQEVKGIDGQLPNKHLIWECKTKYHHIKCFLLLFYCLMQYSDNGDNCTAKQNENIYTNWKELVHL